MNAGQTVQCEICFKKESIANFQCKNYHLYSLCYQCSGIYRNCLVCKNKLVKVSLADHQMRNKGLHQTSNALYQRQGRQTTTTVSNHIDRQYKSIDTYTNKISTAHQQQRQRESPKQPQTIIEKHWSSRYDQMLLDPKYTIAKVKEKIQPKPHTGNTYQKYQKTGNNDQFKLLNDRFSEYNPHRVHNLANKDYQRNKPFDIQKNDRTKIQKQKQSQKVGGHQPINLKKNNYVREHQQSQLLTKQKEIEEARQSIKLKKGYVHNGCQIVHKLYSLVKLIDDSGKHQSFIILSGCYARLEKEFLKKIILDKCLNCGYGNQSKQMLSYELKNGYHICNRCIYFLKQQNQLKEFVEPLLYKCIGCFPDSMKRKRQEMYIEEGKNIQQQMCCKKCFRRAFSQEKILNNMKELKIIHEQRPVIRGQQNYMEKQSKQKPKLNEQKPIQGKKNTQQNQQTLFNNRPQSLPKKKQQKPLNHKQYRRTVINDLGINDYGFKAFIQQKNQIHNQTRQIAQKCILCDTFTYYPVIVDGMSICNGCSSDNKKELQQKQKQQIQCAKIQQNIQKLQKQEIIPKNSLNKHIYDRKRYENEKIMMYSNRHSAEEGKKPQTQKTKIQQTQMLPQTSKTIIKGLAQNNSTKQFLTKQQSSHFRSSDGLHTIPNKKKNIYCDQCHKQIVDPHDIGLKNENGILLCFNCNQLQTQTLQKLPKFQKQSIPVSKDQKAQKAKVIKPNSADIKSSAIYSHKKSSENHISQLEIKPSPQKQRPQISEQSKSSQKCMFKIQSCQQIDQSRIKESPQKSEIKEQIRPTTQLQLMKLKIEGKNIAKEEEKGKLQQSHHQKIEKIPEKQEQQKQKLKQASYQNSRLNSQVSSRKSFVLPSTAKVIRPRVQYSNILTQSMLADNVDNRSMVEKESPERKERSVLDHSLSLVYDPKEEEKLRPTNDQPQQKPFLVTKVSEIKDPHKTKNLTKTDLEHFQEVVTSMSSQDHESSIQKPLAREILEDSYVKQLFHEFSDQKPIKNQKLQIQLQDLSPSSKVKLLNCTLCNLMIEAQKGRMIGNSEIAKAKLSSSTLKTFMCQPCYSKQHLAQKKQFQLATRSRVDYHKQAYQNTLRQTTYKSLRDEDETQRRYRSNAKTPFSNKMAAEKQKVTPSSKYMTPYTDTAYGAIKDSVNMNLNQKSYLEQKFAKNDRKPQTWNSEIPKTQQVSRSRVSYKTQVETNSMAGSKIYICNRCNKDVTLLCFGKYCLECFKKDS